MTGLGVHPRGLWLGVAESAGGDVESETFGRCSYCCAAVHVGRWEDVGADLLGGGVDLSEACLPEAWLAVRSARGVEEASLVDDEL